MNEETAPEKIDRNEQGDGFFVEIVKFTLIALLVIVPLRLFVAQPFVVNGASMDPTFHNGQYLIVDQISYRFEKPKRGEVVIFRYPRDTTKFFIKRIIGLPNETVEIDGTSVIIKNREMPDGFTLNEPYIANNKEDYAAYTLNSHEYFVMGDNRPESSDSRIWGPLDESLVVGRPVIRLFPLGKLGLFPGDYSGTY